MITKEVKFFKSQIGTVSCVGIRKDFYPLFFGNYFWLNDGPRIINMWAENLTEASKRFNLVTVECTCFSNHDTTLAFITDKRIPKDWLNEKLCVTGFGWSTKELCIACLEFANLENRWHYCGCEKLEESPIINWSSVRGYICHRCNRSEMIPYV